MIIATDYGRPMKPFFFIEMQKFWAWVDKFWGIFDQTISIHFGTVSPLSMFFIIQFYKKLSLYSHIPNIYLGLGFGPQRIGDLAFVCPQSVIIAFCFQSSNLQIVTIVFFWLQTIFWVLYFCNFCTFFSIFFALL